METVYRFGSRLTSFCRAGSQLLAPFGVGLLALFLVWPSKAAESEPLPAAYGCSGNEPFWALSVDGDEGRFSRPGGEGVAESTLAGGSRALDFLEPPIFVWRGGPADPGADATALAGDLVVGIVPQRCLDTMADLPPFRYRAVLSLPDGTVATGCCLGGAPADLLDRSWRVVDIAGERVSEGESQPHMLFESGRVSGMAGCNRFFGAFDIEGRAVTIGNLGSSQMMCPEAAMATEALLLEALQAVDRYGFDGTLLALYDEAGEPALRLAPMAE